MNFSSVRSSELHLLFGTLPDAVLLTDRHGGVEYLNPAAEHLTRHSLQDAEGRLLSEILPLGGDVDAPPLSSPAAACLREGESIGPFVARLLTERAAGRVVEVSAGPLLNAEGALDGAIVLIRDITRARLEVRRLAYRASHDSLTGLVNRAEFERRLERAFTGATERNVEHLIGFLDLDGFKRINDDCGHLAGDELLRQLSAIVQGQMRARDTVARLGGDEFGILLEHCTAAEGARIANAIRKAISNHAYVCEGKAHRLGVSVGIVSLRGQPSAVEALRAADSACYLAKHEGGNRVRVHHPEPVDSNP
ncbi:MAG TPA: diguanylate cyclase [Gemmatimonadales bacterium]|nr:diguanylate cyclase [Gemmatimonadales bacterium]